MKTNLELKTNMNISDKILKYFQTNSSYYAKDKMYILHII